MIDLELKIKAVETNEKKIRNIMRKKQKNLRTLPDLSDGVIHAIADELTHKQIQDYDKMENLIYESKVDFDKPTLCKTVSFRGGFMHTGMDNNDEVREHYLTTSGALERTLLAMLGLKGQTYVDKLSGYKFKALN